MYLIGPQLGVILLEHRPPHIPGGVNAAPPGHSVVLTSFSVRCVRPHAHPPALDRLDVGEAVVGPRVCHLALGMYMK